MKYTVDLNDRPVYLQIYRQLRADIVGGAFAYGSRQQTARADARKKYRTQQARIFIIAAQQDDAQSYCGLRGRDT